MHQQDDNSSHDLVPKPVRNSPPRGTGRNLQMRILVSGSTGFVGTALVKTLEGQGHTIAPLVRPGTAPKDVAGVHDKVLGEAVAWDPVAGRFDAAGAEGAD